MKLHFKSLALLVSGVFLALSVGVWAFSIETDFQNLVQYIKRVVITADGGNGSTVYVDLNKNTTGEVYIKNKLAIGTSGVNAQLAVEGKLIVADMLNSYIGNNVEYGSILGAQYSVLLGDNSVIVAGSSNRVDGEFNFLGGGINNKVDGSSSVVIGGNSNETKLNSDYSFLIGGYDGILYGDRSGILGGYDSILTGNDSMVLGGTGNKLSGDYSLVVSSYGSTVLGNNGVIVGGRNNYVNGQYGAVVGGYSNTVSEKYGIAMGNRAKSVSTGTFVWADSQEADFTSTKTNTFLVRAQNGVGINTNNPRETLDVNGAIIVGNSSSVTPITGTIKFSGDNNFRGYAGTTKGWKQLNSN